ncbi:hypothetical protein A3D77_00455 [Candidatus Gottesmanbacteria bacterium RIFCSPHIGHO2_02_FULL_39_11]|uniref:Nudix hydrolase domain-containing protein n=1 Tax=Candidatus Gottesmanbacteria bacterium RIFCSPHIGHO2_02_FULL_39_11 TaxID=1798382 RepID=A0A1F5ZL08_9BACT|nr:MAG: hypothetical protein A3D77_00455 [Candidatus Gottesmanbacteria bacterium RIFCSPHIGHO2_02_FULL_39_11]
MSDLQEELFDVVNESDRVVGQITRGEAHKNPNIIHRSVGIGIFNAHKELFLQKRSKSKDSEPGKWTISCSGHVIAGQYYLETAHRELLEELGIDLKVHPFEKIVCRYPWETEMTYFYRSFNNGPFTLNKDEIDEGRFFKPGEIYNQLREKTLEISLLLRIILPKFFPAINWTIVFR